MSLKKAILRTLAYADIFDYPLTPKELYCFLITGGSLNYPSFRQALTRIKANEKRIETNRNYFFLRGRQEIVAVRKKRKEWSEEKLKIASQAGRWLWSVPWIKMVAVTGALAMKNSDQEDDVDFLIVTAENRLWFTRLLTVFLVELVAQRRRPQDQAVKDKICLNMFLDESDLCLPQEEQNLFTAHEVCQLKPLWSRGRAYEKFLSANEWVKKYLSNALGRIPHHPRSGRMDSPGVKGEKRMPLISRLLDYLEILAGKVQVLYMASRRTTEIVEPHRLRFHPQDCREWVLREYRQRLKRLRLASSLV